LDFAVLAFAVLALDFVFAFTATSAISTSSD
jgi:hypothetical protein